MNKAKYSIKVELNIEGEESKLKEILNRSIDDIRLVLDQLTADSEFVEKKDEALKLSKANINISKVNEKDISKSLFDFNIDNGQSIMKIDLLHEEHKKSKSDKEKKATEDKTSLESVVYTGTRMMNSEEYFDPVDEEMPTSTITQRVVRGQAIDSNFTWRVTAADQSSSET